MEDHRQEKDREITVDGRSQVEGQGDNSCLSVKNCNDFIHVQPTVKTCM